MRWIPRNWMPFDSGTLPLSSKQYNPSLALYWKFIPNFFNIIAPLNSSIQKNESWAWTWLQQNAFKTLKQIFFSASILQISNVSYPFTVMTNASLLATGTVLIPPDTNGDLHSCAYFSKTFASTEQNLRTPCSHYCSGWMASVPLRNLSPCHHYHWPQKPLLY